MLAFRVRRPIRARPTTSRASTSSSTTSLPPKAPPPRTSCSSRVCAASFTRATSEPVSPPPRCVLPMLRSIICHACRRSHTVFLNQVATLREREMEKRVTFGAGGGSTKVQICSPRFLISAAFTVLAALPTAPHFQGDLLDSARLPSSQTAAPVPIPALDSHQSTASQRHHREGTVDEPKPLVQVLVEFPLFGAIFLSTLRVLECLM